MSLGGLEGSPYEPNESPSELEMSLDEVDVSPAELGMPLREP